MKAINYVYCSVFVLATTIGFAQEQNQVYLKGTVVEASTNAPLEYASITIESTSNPNNITGDMTDESGTFNIPVTPDTYQIRIEYLGYKTFVIDSKEITASTSLGIVKIECDSEILDGVVIEARRARLEVMLVKLIYNFVYDNIARSVVSSDVFDKYASVEVDSEGNVSLRGNESVRVLIYGKPSGMASNIADALKMLSSESIERVEVITNRSEEHTSELQSRPHLVCRLLLEKKKKKNNDLKRIYDIYLLIQYNFFNIIFTK